MMQLLFVPAALAKKKHKDAEGKPAAAAVPATASQPAAVAPASTPAAAGTTPAVAPVSKPVVAAPIVPAPAPTPHAPVVAPAPTSVVVAAPIQAPAAPPAVPVSQVAEPEPLPLPAADAPIAGAPGYDPSDIEVVKVTVDRREKNIQSYAGSASAYSQEDLQRVGVNSVRDLSAVSPSLEIGTQEGNTEIFIRGVGSTNNTELGDPSAATHVDGIYIPRPRGVGSMFYDLERVEVNRGPQGTIRGRNATAGSLNVITAKPKLSLWEASGEMQVGNYSQRLATAMVNIPLGDNLALRLAAFGEEHDPFYKNAGPVTTITPAESADNLAYRATLKWLPLHNLTVLAGTDF
ncbi:MAG TPA: TonB-dependent receptor plug domain-containing protein, partial [Polyangia bacterium]